jgi:peptidoglycan/LPS O-acetylase OafA/YrhL
LTFRKDIQALRGIAVALVVVFHAWPAVLPGGFVGVDVFFVISGFLITGLLVDEQLADGRLDLIAFYARRARRLLPAACLVIVATMLAVALMRSAFEAREQVPGAVAAALYVSNLRFAWQSVDYLSDGLHADPLLHTWSLGVEEQFYLLWPLALTALARWLPARRAAALLLVLVGLASLAAAVTLTPVIPSWSFFGLPTRAWEFAAGAAAWLLRPTLLSWPRVVRMALSWAGLAFVFGAALFFSARTGVPGPAALLPVGGALLALAAGGDEVQPAWLDPLHSRVMQALGDHSYALYLWHWPVLILLVDLWPGATVSARGAAGVVLSLLLAWATCRWVENPVRFNRRLRARPRVSLVAGLAVVLATAGFAAASPALSSIGGDVVARRKAEFAIRDRPRLYDDRCFATALDVEPPSCVYGPSDAKATVVLFGDSHAAQWFPALEALGARHGLRVAVFVKAACPVALVEPFDTKLGRAYTECSRWRETALARIEQLRPALVVAANASSYEAFVGTKPDDAARAAWQRSLEAALQRLVAASGHVLLLRDTPRPAAHVPRCVAREAAARRDPQAGCSFDAESPAARRGFATEQAAVATLHGVTTIDLGAAVCPRDPCPIEQQGLITFHDGEHLSASFARALAPGLWRRVPATVRDVLARRDVGR